MSFLKYTIDEKESGIKLGNYLKCHANLSTRLIRSALREKRIYVNGKAAKASLLLKNKDKLLINLEKNESQDITPEKMNLQIAYEDEDILVINKPCNMVVHPTRNYITGTLANGILYYFKETGQSCIVRLVSRLDMDTSGLIIVAKNQFAHMKLSKELVKEEYEKNYIAVIHGHMENKKGTINLPIYRPEDGGIKRVVDERGQESITDYEVLENFKDAQLLKLTLKTGRTHQIRVHLSHLGHPIFGDSLYGIEETLIHRQALHAYRLVIPQPRTEEKLEIETELPTDIKNLIEALKKDVKV